MCNDARVVTVLQAIERVVTANKAFVDRVITVSGGALALSVTFRAEIAGGASHLWLLKCAWTGLALCTAAGVFLHRAEASAAKRQVAAIRKNDSALVAVQPHALYKLLWWLLLLGFPVSLAALCAFAVVNTH